MTARAAEPERVLPNNKEAERSIIGATLVNNAVWAVTASIVTQRSFYSEAHRRIFAALERLHERGQPLDLVLLTEQLRRDGNLDEVGGPAYIASLVDGVPVSTNVEYYARVVLEKAQLRDAIYAANKLLAGAYEAERDPGELIDAGVQTLLGLSGSNKGQCVTVGEAVTEYVNSLDAEHGTVIQSGMLDLDALVGGFERKRLSVVAARPSVGKSSFALAVADKAAERGEAAAIITLEMEPPTLAGNLLAAHSRVESDRLRRKIVTEQQWQRISDAVSALADRPLYLVNGLETLTQIAAWVRRLRETHGVQMVWLDYLQLLGNPQSPDRQGEVARYSRGLRKIAKDEDVAMVVLAQLSRATEARRDKRPQLADLRESGAIEQDADLVVLLFREEMYKPTDDNHGIGELIVAKNRTGPVGTVKAVFMAHTARWDNLAIGA